MRLVPMVLAILLAGVPAAHGSTLFSDGFSPDASPSWGNQSGDWTASGGVYFAQSPGNSPPTQTLLPFTLTDFRVDVDVNNASDGGIWLRLDANGDGLLLVIGGFTGANTGVYIHAVDNGNPGAILAISPAGLFATGDEIHVAVEVAGDDYAVFLNGGSSPVLTLTNSSFASGRTGLYGYDPLAQNTSFDNFVITVAGPEAAPLPGALVLLGAGLTAAAGFGRRLRRSA